MKVRQVDCLLYLEKVSPEESLYELVPLEMLHVGLLAANTLVVWFNNLLIGRETEMMPLLEASIKTDVTSYKGNSDVAEVILKNYSDSKFILSNRGEFNFQAKGDLVTVPPHSTVTLLVKTLKRLSSVELEFEVMNALTALRTHPIITFFVALP